MNTQSSRHSKKSNTPTFSHLKTQMKSFALIAFAVLGLHESSFAIEIQYSDYAQKLNCEDLNDERKIKELARFNLESYYYELSPGLDPCKVKDIPRCQPGSNSVFLQRLPKVEQDLIREAIARCSKELKAARGKMLPAF